MTATRAPLGTADPAPIFETADGNRRVVVIAMKTQLRGRIRRSVTTLLEQGAEVTVLGLKSDKDFTVGLDHPRLTVELLDPSSVYIWLVRRQQRAAANRKRRVQRVTRSEPVRALAGAVRSTKRTIRASARRIVTTLLAPVRALRSALRRVLDSIERPEQVDEEEEVVEIEEEPLPDLVPVPDVGRIADTEETLRTRLEPRFPPSLVAPLARLLSVPIHGLRVLRRTIRLQARRVRHLARRARRFVRRLGGRIRRLPRRARRAVRRTFLRTRRFGIRSRRRALRARRRLSRRRTLGRRARRRRAQERRKNRMLALRRRVLPWHRITRWADFWRISRDRALEHRPDFVVSSDLPGLVGANRAANELGVPHAHDCHELYLESTSLRPIERTLLAPIERRYMRRTDAIVIVNESIRAEYAQRYAVDGTVIRNCAEQGDVQPGQDLYELTGASPDAQLVLYQGGFSVGRGLDVVINAVTEFPERAHLVMMGYGPMEEELQELAETIGVADRVTFVEAVPPEQLLSTTATATLGLVPYQPVSANNRLALPNKIFEYTTVGLPVVVSDIPELARIANEGAGLTYDPFDPSDLARAVSEILAPSAIEDAQASSRAWGRANTWEIEQRKLIDVWRGALESASSRGGR